jgi:hypothetical protein
MLSVLVGSAVPCILMATSIGAEHQGKSHGSPDRAHPSDKKELATPKPPEALPTPITSGAE